ncbi:MAG TPA: TonB-dependent receptor [Bacteroidales bacterium]|nr:TonB-dependent receptor [Bacteroidales bacterium]
MKRIISTTVILTLLTTWAFSQKFTQTVRGTVIDNDNKLPLIGVIVTLPASNPQVAAATDVNGNFRLEKVPVGRISLQLNYVGYDGLTLSNIEVNSGKEVVLEITMKESIIKIDDVVVKAYRKKGEAINDMALLSSKSISTEQTKRYTGGMEDPARVVSSFAGVTSSPDGSSDIIVRGNSPKYMQWRLDGIEIPSPYHMDDQNASMGALTALNNNLLSTSDFYTGAFSSEYGNVLSNVMDVKLRSGNNEKMEATCGIGILGTDLTLEGPFKKGYGGSYLINYRYSTVSLMKKIGLVDVDGVVNYQDATFKVLLPTKKVGTFSFFGLGGLSGFSMDNIKLGAFTTPGSPAENANVIKDYDKSAFLANFGINHTLTVNNNSFVKTSLSYSGNGFDDDIYSAELIKTYDNEGVLSGDSAINRHQSFESRVMNSAIRGAISYSNKINAKNKIQVGIKYTLNHFDYNQNIYNNQSAAMINVTDFRKSGGLLNSYINWKSSINDKITLVAGLHSMNVLINNKYTLEPRIAVNWKLGNTGSVHAGYGKHSTMESVHNYFTKIQQPDGTTTEPNKNLGLLKSDHFVVGYEKRFGTNLLAKVEAYYQNLYNLPVENLDTSYYATINEGIDYRYVALVNKGIGKNYGVEFTLERFFDDNYYFLINATLYDSKYKSLEGIWRNTQYNSRYLVNLLCGKEFKNIGHKQNKTLAVNAKVFLGGGKKYIPLLRDAQGNVSVDPSHNKFWDYKKAYDNKLDNIYYVNLSVSYKINRSHATHEIFVDMMNLTNNQARLSEYYDESKQGKVGYLKQMYFIPNIMYRIYF